MHDTHLIEKIYQSIVTLCKQNSIVKVHEICMEVDEGSHIDAPHLLDHLIERDHTLFSDNTIIQITRQPYKRLTAVITRIDGEGCE